MVAIFTNRTEYRNDIAEELMLFLGIVDTTLAVLEDEPHGPAQTALAGAEGSPFTDREAACLIDRRETAVDAEQLQVTVLLRQTDCSDASIRLNGVNQSDGAGRPDGGNGVDCGEKDGAAGRVLRYELTASVGERTLTHAFAILDSTPLAVKKREKREIKLTIFALMQARFPNVETPWGSLTGIRPTKLFRELAAETGEAEARRQFADTFSVSPAKTALAETICRVQRPFIERVGSKDIDVYIGIPFCKTRCLYCSFVSEVLRSDALLDAYLAALREDIRAGAELVIRGGYRVRAMYVGGGTPTVLSAAQLYALLSAAFDAYGGFGEECTVEAGRPDTIDRQKLAVLKSLGVARISINPQSMNDETLKRVGRAHSVEETLLAYGLARDMGFETINMDVIAGLPGETPEDMQRTYAALEPLDPENLTVHTLAVKRSSLLKAKLEEYPMATAEEAARMVADGAALSVRLGMQPYYLYRQKYMRGNLENVGYAKPGHICAYNIDMMEETASILAHGAGSMTKRVFSSQRRIERLPNPKDVSTYLDKLPAMLERKRRFFLD